MIINIELIVLLKLTVFKKLSCDSDDREKVYKGFIDELKGFYNYET